MSIPLERCVHCFGWCRKINQRTRRCCLFDGALTGEGPYQLVRPFQSLKDPLSGEDLGTFAEGIGRGDRAGYEHPSDGGDRGLKTDQAGNH